MQNTPSARPNNSLSVISLVSGLGGWICVPVWFCVGLLPFIGLCITPLFVLIPVAWVTSIATGHIAIHQIKTSGENGRSYAITGLLLGYVGLAMAALAFIGLIVVLVLSNGDFLPLPPK